MIKYVVFDFDGTLADTFDEMKNMAEEEFGFSGNDFEQIRKDGLREMIKTSGLSIKNFYTVAFNIKSKLNNISNIKLFPNIIETLKELKSDYKLGIVSSNSEENIKRTLSRYGLEEVFDFIHSDSSFFGKHKVLTRVCKRLNVKPQEIIYIGDEDRDIKAAKKKNIKNIAVSWGFNSTDRLKEVEPDFLAHEPREITEYVGLL